jgi:predicted permease
MNGPRYLLRKLVILFRGTKFDSDLQEEMSFHQEQCEKELIADGIAPNEARYQAKRQFGNDTRLREQSHDLAGFWFEGMLHDARFALRQLRKNPAFAATAILILALGICTSVAFFAFADAAMIKPLPYREPARLVHMYESIPLGPRYHLSWPDYVDWKRENKVFSSFDVYENDGFMLTEAGGAKRVSGARTTAGFFRTLGVNPVLGRDFHSGEDEPSAPAVVMLSYSEWQKRYGGRQDVIGQRVILDGEPNTIIGVLPADFHFAPAEPADFWSTTLHAPRNCRGCHSLFGVARLKDGVSFEAAYANITTIAQQLQLQYPDTNRDQNAYMVTLSDAVVGDIRPILTMLLAGAALLLLIACVNVASLLLVRSEHRRREIAVRGALGASRARLMRQFVTEGISLVAVGTLLGLASAYWLMRVLAKLVPKDMMESMPFLHELTLNPRVIVFAIVIAALAALLFSVTPAWRLRAAVVRDDLAEGGRSSSGMAWRRLGGKLVVIELATAVLLLVGAGLLSKSFYHLLQVSPGMQTDHLAAVNISMPSWQYSKDPQQLAAQREIVRQVASLPGVKSVGVSSNMPLGDADGTRQFVVVGRPPDAVNRESTFRLVDQGYFATLKTPLISGRYFNEQDDASRPRVAMINEALAKRFFAGENPLGKWIEFNYGAADDQAMQIVGVVAEVKEGQLDMAPRSVFYVPIAQNPISDFAVIVRTAQEPQELISGISAVVHGFDPNISTFGGTTMDQRMRDSPSAYMHRSAAWLAVGFAVLALLLGVVGLYGVIAYSVSQRTREIGVRMALGAQRSTIYRLILQEAGSLVAFGVVVGLLCSLAGSIFLRKLLFGVSAWDLSTLAMVAFLLAFSALLASYIPAYRAASTNLTESLRAE